MANISQQEIMELPQTNGVLDGFTEDEKSKMRPADIDADMREMERRKRVEMMMNSRLFREELERIIETQMKDGSGPSGLLQQISEMMGPQGARFNTNVFRNSNCVVPINDIRGVESMGYAKGEKLLRCKLAAVFRLLDLYGWTQGVGGMITARLNQDQEHFLVNPYGLLYHEVTASSLIKVDMQGGVVEQGTTNFGVHIAGYQLHSTIHAARPDIKCIVHIATPSVTAVSSTKCGLLPLGQESIVIGEVSNHHYISNGNLDSEEREKLSRNFGPINKVMLLTNRGALCCGETVEEAFFNVYNTVLACETQLKLMPVGIDNLSLLSDEERKVIYESSRKAPVPQHSTVAEPSPLVEKLEKRWRIGGTEFEALMRMLDNAGFRTGYIYRYPLVKSEPPRPRNDVEVPPAVSSLGYLLEEEELYKQGLWKGGRKGTDRTRWLNSPNVYQKVEILETGTPDPKKITKWVSDGSPTHSSTPVKIDGALQFVPKNTNPKEFKQLQQQIKDYRRADKISAGPQSHILEGVTWEEAKKMQDATISGTGEQVVLVGAASKGIIQRGFQHNATVYKTPYAKNPFDAVTDLELDQYKKEIERKTKGDPYDESQSESEALSSFNISRITHESSTAKSPIQSPVSATSETEEESRDEPKVLRIETKQVPAPSQPEVVLSDGISGVSRLSSSRSNSSSEDVESWLGCYEACHLETTRVQELARPMKVLITEIQKASTRKMKRDFFKNYEKRLINNNCLKVESDSKLFVIDTMAKFDSIRSKFDTKLKNKNSRNESEIKKLGVRRQLHNGMQFSKNENINFAEKVNMVIDYTVIKNEIYDMNKKCKEGTISSPIIIEMNLRNMDKKEDSQLNDLYSTVENCSDNTLKAFSDHELGNDENKKLYQNNHMKSIEYIQNVNPKKDADIYVNEVEFSICDDYNNQYDSNNCNIHSKKFYNDIKIKVQNDNNYDSTNAILKNKNNICTSNENNNEIINYINEVEFSTYNNLCFNDETKCKYIEYSSMITLQQLTKNNVNNISEKNTLEFLPSTVYIRELNINNNFDKEHKDHQMQKKAYIYNNFVTSNTNTVEKNLIDSYSNIHLNIENTILLDQPCNDVKRVIKFNEESSDLVKTVYNKKSDENGNVWPSVNKDSMNCFNNSPEKLSKVIPNSLDFTYSEIDKFSEDFSPASTTKESLFSDDDLVMKRITRRDSIAEVASSINADIKPSNKVTMDMLADTENSIKYNLNSQNMSLIYSITPTNDIDDSSKNTTIEDILEDNEDNYVNYKSFNNNDEIIRINSKNERKDINMNKTIELSETSFASNVSNQGSDLLELPTHTFLDLQKSSDEIFEKNMSTSVNQIIHELNDAELYVNAENFVDEILYDIACLNLPRNISEFSKLELNNFIQDKILALNLIKKIAKDLVENLQCYDADRSTNSKVSNKEELNYVESLDHSVYIIQEIIYHIIDTDDLGKCDSKNKKIITDKKAKESINIELKGLKDDYDASDEKNMKCSTPKILSPSKSNDNSFSEDQIILNIDEGIENPLFVETIPFCNLNCQPISKVPVSSNSSPTESQNFAEQEITSESTDNDTKSDNSKEKHINVLREALSHRSNFSNFQINSRINSPTAITHNQNSELRQSSITQDKMSYCVIEYSSEMDQYLQSSDDLTLKSSDCLRTKTHDQKNKAPQLDAVNKKISYCVIECINKGESTQNLCYDDKRDIDTDSNDSIKDFMQKFEDQEEIYQLWRVKEEKFEEICATERLKIINTAENIDCEENANLTSEPNEIEDLKKSTSNNFKLCDDIINTHQKFEAAYEDFPYYAFLDISSFNVKQSISSIKEETESEFVDNMESINSPERLPPITEVPELNSSCDEYIDNMSDTKTTEFYSYQNSVSFKSWDEQETANSTFIVSVDPNSDCDKAYSADISANVSSDSSTVDCRSKFAMWEEIIAYNDVTANFADVSNLNLSNNTCEATLECMTSSYDTKEFIQIELGCQSSSEFFETG